MNDRVTLTEILVRAGYIVLNDEESAGIAFSIQTENDAVIIFMFALDGELIAVEVA